MGKGEIAHYEQFLLFPLCFQNCCFLGASKGVIVWEWVKWRNATEVVGKLIRGGKYALHSICYCFLKCFLNEWILLTPEKELWSWRCFILSPFPKQPLFLCFCSSYLLKTLWEQEKLLITSNLSFSKVFSNPMENFAIFIQFEIVF